MVQQKDKESSSGADLVQGAKNKTRKSKKGKRKLKIIVCGGRNYDDKEFVYYVLDKVNPDIVVHGAARGADSLADEWCSDRGREVRRYPAKWNLHGRSAGPLRNREMLASELEDLDGVIAFPSSSGTADMIHIARKALPPKSVFLLQRK